MPEKKKRDAPFSLRFTWEQLVLLRQWAEAMSMSVAAYIKWRLFESDKPPEPPRTRGRHPVKDHAVLARLLSLLGNLRLAANINQLAKAANSGSLPVTPEVAAALMQACQEISDMRRMLIKALGLDAGDAR